MFGKPQWIKPKTFGWGIHPITWQGWSWCGIWLGVMLVPFTGFMSQRDMWTEAFIWLGASTGVMIMDVWQILRAMNPPPARVLPPRPVPVAQQAKPTSQMPDDGILFINDGASGNVGTRNYDFRVRKS